jgi:hypothetical protein
LHGFGLEEGLLHGMKVFAVGQPFNGCDLLSACGTCRRNATPHGSTVEQHRAGPALALATPILGSSQAEPVPQNVQKWLFGPSVDLMFTFIHLKGESHDATSRKV